MGRYKPEITTLEAIKAEYIDNMLGDHASEYDTEKILKAIAMPTRGGWIAVDLKLHEYIEIVKSARIQS